MKPLSDQPGIIARVWDYVRNLTDQSPYWRTQAMAWGIALIVVVASGAIFAVVALSSVFGGGDIHYEAKGSPGPVTFRHYTHMWFKDGKYKSCETCHDKLFAPQAYGTYVFRALRDSPDRKIHIGKEASTLYTPVPLNKEQPAETLQTYQIPRACRTCATGSCHDGKETFSRFDCLGCHQRR
jgi:hypothetical protein